MKKILTILSLTFGISAFAQVGINTENPKATLEITNKGAEPAKGLLIPRMTADEVKTMTDAGGVGTDQNSLLLYITALFTDVANKTGKYELIDQAGYYYYDANDAGGKWKKLDITLYGSNGTLSADRTVTMDGKTLTFNGNNAQIKVPNMQERLTSEDVSTIVMATDGTFKKDSNWWTFQNSTTPPEIKKDKIKKYLLDIGYISIGTNEVKVNTEFEYGCHRPGESKFIHYKRRGILTIPKADWIEGDNSKGTTLYFVKRKRNAQTLSPPFLKAYKYYYVGMYFQCCTSPSTTGTVFWLAETGLDGYHGKIDNGRIPIREGYDTPNNLKLEDFRYVRECDDELLYIHRDIRAIQYED